MTLPTHVILGAIIGKATGDYTFALISSIAPDLDHLSSYIKSGVIKSPKKFWKTITDQDDPYQDQRGILHNAFFFLVVSALLILVFHKIYLVLVLGWLGHLFLDALDASDYWPFYPSKKINLRGPIKYFSYQELLLSIILMFVYWVV